MYRIETKGNCYQNGKKTCFKLFVKEGDAFVFRGQFYVAGWSRTDDQCVAGAIKQMAEDDDDFEVAG